MKSYRKKIIDKFRYAISGILHGIQYDRSIRLQVIFGIMVCIAGCLFSLAPWEWCFIGFAVGLVIAFEYINSALEHVVDMVSPNYHPIAKIIKDYAAAAVLIISVIAAVIGIIIFGGKVWW